MLRNTNQIISTFRGTMKVETLIRVNNVTGTEFPVSGDAPLRQAWETLDPITAVERLAPTKPILAARRAGKNTRIAEIKKRTC